MFVRVTILVQGCEVAAEEVKDKSLASALKQMGEQIGHKLDGVRCPTHGKPPTDVRVHIGKSGDGDLRYESCCKELQSAVAAATT